MAGQITSLRFQKRNQDRVNVYLDGEYAFALPALEAAKLRKGQFLSDTEIEQLRSLDLAAKAFDKAVRFLGSRPRSEWEIRQNLRRYRPRQADPLTDEQIDGVIDRLKAHHYIDDHEFARYWIEQRNRFKPLGPRAIRYELRSKGVDARIVDSVVEAETDPTTAALTAARSRAERWLPLGEEAFKQKVSALLQRRGFNWDVIREVTQQIWQEHNTDKHL